MWLYDINSWTSNHDHLDVIVGNLQGAVESVSVGEIKLCLLNCLAKLGVDSISRDPKLQLVISDLEVVTRISDKSSKKSTTRKPKKSSGSKPGKGKVMAVANMARFLSLSVRDLAVKVCFCQKCVCLFSKGLFGP